MIRTLWPSFEDFEAARAYGTEWPLLLQSLKKGKRNPPAGEDILKAYRNGDEVSASFFGNPCKRC